MIQIDQLQIMLPGGNQQDGTELGRLVAERLAEAIPENYANRQIPELNLQLQGVSSNDVSQMADQIVSRIVRELKLALL